MKNNKIYSASACGIFETMADDDAVATAFCHNLRPSQLDGLDSVLSPVLPPEQLIEGSWLPLVETHPAEDIDMLIVADGPELAAYVDDELLPIATLDSDVLCAAACGRELTVMTADGAFDWYYDEVVCDWVLIDPDDIGAFSLMAAEASDCEVAVEPRLLSTDYSSTGMALRDVDRRAVDSDLKDAYAAVVAQAAARGAFCAPTLMRYRIIDRNGDVMSVSPPMLLGAADSARLTGPISVTSHDRRRLDGYTVAARSWHPRLVCHTPPGSNSASLVSRIELLACPQFHPFDPAADASVDLVTAAGSDTMLRLTLPGAGKAVAPANGDAAVRHVEDMIAVMDRYERVVAVVERPFDRDTPLDMILDCHIPFGSVADECSLADEACSATPVVADENIVRLSPPHRFSARCVASVADTVVWGGLSALRFRGYAPQMFAASRGGTGPWHAALAVTFASGREQVVAVGQGDSGAPLTFNPVLSYPSPDAVSMTLIVSSGGEVRRGVFPLTPDPSRRRAVYIDRSFAPVTLDETVPLFVVPPERKVAGTMLGYVAAASAHSPTDIRAVGYVGDGAVEHLLPTSRSQSSWDFTRPRFTAFTPSGIHTLTLSSSRTVISPSLIDSRRPKAAIVAGSRVLAVAGDCLVEVGASRAKTLLENISADLLAFDSSRGELWMSQRTVGTSVVVRLSDLSRYTRDESLTAPGLGHYAVIGGNLCDLTADQPVQSVPARWSAVFSFGKDFRRVRRLRLDIRSNAVTYGNLQLSRRSLGDSEPRPSLRLTLDGRIGSPVDVPVVASPMRSATVTFQGRVSPDTLISSLDLYL